MADRSSVSRARTTDGERVLEGGAAALGLVRERGESVESFNDRIRNGLADVCASAAWRCETCGKWSHALRKPAWHRRLILDDPRDDDVVVEVREGMEHDTGAPIYAYVIRCGPFKPYVVVPDFDGRTTRLVRRELASR